MKINNEKLNSLEKKSIPNTVSSKNPDGFIGFFEPRVGYNKLVAYGPSSQNFKPTWIHKEYTI